MSSQISPLEKVHTGLWIDHAEGNVKGLTLTVSSTTGAYLIAFLAIFVRLSAGNLWNIISYVWFVWQQTDKARDGLFYQQQALLRGSLSDSSALWQFATTAWAWRHKTRHPILRTLPIILAAVMHFVTFTLASIFSSRVTSVHSSVLISGPACGDWVSATVFNQSAAIEAAEMDSWLLNSYKTAQTLSSSCHVFNSTATSQNLQDCRAWGRDFISWTVDQTDQCPFAGEMCVDGLAVQIETEKVDSLKHLGINSSPEDRIQVKLTLQCAPIKTDGFVRSLTNFNETGIDPSYASPAWSPILGLRGYEYGPSEFSPNYTFVYMNTTFGHLTGNSQQPSYAVDVEEAYINHVRASTYVPIPQLNRTDADVVLWFVMQNNLVFVEPITDPIFRADVPVTWTVTDPYYDNGDIDVMLYQPPTPLTVLGCAQQWQWFQPDESRSGKKATQAGGVARLDASELNYNERQGVIQERVYNQIFNANINLMTVGLGNNVFLASTASGLGEAGSYLPPDQWIRELDYWTSIYWNTVQLLVAQNAVGSGIPQQDRYRVLPDDWKWICHAQIVQRSDFTSFNMLGFLIILCFGVFFIILNVTLDPMVQWYKIRRAAKDGAMPINLWRNAGVLHLQSVALEAASKGQWERQKFIPTTIEPERFEFSWLPEGYTDEQNQISATNLTNSENSSMTADTKGARGTAMSLSGGDSFHSPSFESSARLEMGEQPVEQRPSWLECFAQRMRPQDSVADVVR